MAIVVRVAGMTRLVILILVFKEKFERIIDGLLVRADKFERSYINGGQQDSCESGTRPYIPAIHFGQAPGLPGIGLGSVP